MSNNSVAHSFLKSALTLENPFLSTENFIDWLEEKKANVNHKITPIKFSEMSNWGFNKQTGNLEHNSGKFFSIEGINVKDQHGRQMHCWRSISGFFGSGNRHLHLSMGGTVCRKQVRMMRSSFIEQIHRKRFLLP